MCFCFLYTYTDPQAVFQFSKPFGIKLPDGGSQINQSPWSRPLRSSIINHALPLASYTPSRSGSDSKTTSGKSLPTILKKLNLAAGESSKIDSKFPEPPAQLRDVFCEVGVSLTTLRQLKLVNMSWVELSNPRLEETNHQSEGSENTSERPPRVIARICVIDPTPQGEGSETGADTELYIPIPLAFRLKLTEILIDSSPNNPSNSPILIQCRRLDHHIKSSSTSQNSLNFPAANNLNDYLHNLANPYNNTSSSSNVSVSYTVQDNKLVGQAQKLQDQEGKAGAGALTRGEEMVGSVTLHKSLLPLVPVADKVVLSFSLSLTHVHFTCLISYCSVMATSYFRY